MSGTAINPEKETALPISIRSLITKLVGLKKNWKKTKESKDDNITRIMFMIKSLKVKLYNLKTFKNSTGIKRINVDTQNKIMNQNKPWAFHVVTDFSTIPIDSSRI